MRSLMFSTITGLGLMVSGILVANITSDQQGNNPSEMRGGIAKLYSSDTLLLDNHKHMIRLADIPAPGRDFAEESLRIRHLTQLIGSGEVRCTKVKVDSYGMDLAQCWNYRGESLNAALAAFTG